MIGIENNLTILQLTIRTQRLKKVLALRILQQILRNFFLITIDYIEYLNSIWPSLCDHLRRIIQFHKKCKSNGSALIHANPALKTVTRDLPREINMHTSI